MSHGFGSKCTWGGRERVLVLFRCTEGVQEGCMGVIGFGGKISC
nr:hypothetical protein [Tanacetum cinerariifolium]